MTPNDSPGLSERGRIRGPTKAPRAVAPKQTTISRIAIAAVERSKKMARP
jgi:hypothetical protein